MATTTVREHRLAAGYATFIPGPRSAPSSAQPSIPRGRLRSCPHLCRPGSTPCAALARRGRSQHPRLGPRVRLPPAPIPNVPRQAWRTTSRTHAGPTTCSHPASRRLLDNALPRSPLRAVICPTAVTPRRLVSNGPRAPAFVGQVTTRLFSLVKWASCLAARTVAHGFGTGALPGANLAQKGGSVAAALLSRLLSTTPVKSSRKL